MNLHVKFSAGNSKMGKIKSVSLPALLTCRSDCECLKKCYAWKLMRLRPTVRNAYQNNLDVLNNDPELYWKEVETAIKASRFFRFHVSGDIPSPSYFTCMLEAAHAAPHCEILCFTKKFDIVNSKLSAMQELGIELPKNLHLIFSGWRGLEMDNPFGLPEAHVRYKDGSTTASRYAFECGGNCTECAEVNVGCWALRNGQQVVFNEH